MIHCTHLDMRARRSSELNLLKVDPMAEEGPPGPPPEEDSSGGCEVMCSSCEPERKKDSDFRLHSVYTTNEFDDIFRL